MSGVRQHYIPRFIQKGFVNVRSNGKESYSYVVKKSGASYLANLKNIAVERYFYAHEEEPDLDDAITIKEIEYDDLMVRMRTGGEFSAREAAELVAHLEIRNRTLRDNLYSASELVWSQFRELLGDEGTLRGMLNRLINPRSDMFRDECMKHGVDVDLVLALDVLNPGLLEKVRNDIVSATLVALSSFGDDAIRRMARAGHLRALDKTLSPPAKIEVYKNFDFKVREYKNGSLPLGDTMVFFVVEGRQKYVNFTQKDDELKAIVFPISSGSYLIGGEVDEANFQQDLPCIIAATSSDFILVAETDAVSDEVRESIGRLSGILDEKEFKESILSGLLEALSKY